MSRLRRTCIVALVMLGACVKGTEPKPSTSEPEFVIDAPPLAGNEGRLPTNGSDVPGGGAAAPSEDSDARVALQEADIIQLVGKRLYALSTRGGLSIIDISHPDALHVIGRYRHNAEPFEMYVEGDRAFVMFRSFGGYVFARDVGYAWRTDSRLVSLDVSDPGDIQVIGEVELPGAIQDSRRKGDVLYVVTHEDGYCYGCESTPNTAITSFDISNPRVLRQVDQLRLPIEAGSYSGGQRSVYSTTERMYVGGPIWNPGGDERSMIDVIDITDASGVLAQGTRVQVAGEIQNRWQMDEAEGVLRVISQPVPWAGMQEPVIETFRVTSARAIDALGRAELVLPQPESLRSARFDGPRAYAITAQQTDPLFTIDLSDPQHPRQAGTLELPGWVYHMVPLGDRLLGLGYDASNRDGTINASLFDVSDLENPALLSRVHFGGDWANFAEDQNRIHKSLAILPDDHLLLIPFSGWQQQEGGCGRFLSGVQLIDFRSDTLELRGLAEQTDRSRRSFVQGERLFAVSDSMVQSYDISDRDAPAEIGHVAIATSSQRSVIMGEHLARLASDWTVGTTRLQIVNRSEPDAPDPLGEIVLDDVLERTHKPGVTPACERFGFSDIQMFSRHDFVYLLYQDYASITAATKLATLDVSDPTAPELVNTLALPFTLGWSSGYYLAGAADGGSSALLVGDTLVLHRAEVQYDGRVPRSRAKFELVDLSDPAQPQRGQGFERVDAMGHGQLLAFGDHVVSSAAQALDPDGTRVAFFAERLDLSDAQHPVALAAVNVPGPIVAYNVAAQRAVAVEYEYETLLESDAGGCYDEPKTVGYDSARMQCTLLHQRLGLLQFDGDRARRIRSVDVEGDKRLLYTLGSQDLVFAQVGQGYSYWFGAEVGDLPQSSASVAIGPGGGLIGYRNLPVDLVTLSGVAEGKFEEASRYSVTLEQLNLYQARIAGSRLLMPSYGAGLAVFDASDPSDPTLTVNALYGYTCQDLSVAQDTAYCALGDYGMQAIPISK